MSDSLWHVAVQTAAESLLSYQRHLELLQVLLQLLEERLKADAQCTGAEVDDEVQKACRALAPLLVTLLDRASIWYSSGQQQQAAAAIAAASTAAAAWQESCSLRRGRCSSAQQEDKRVNIGYGTHETDSVAAIITMTAQLLKQVQQLPTNQVGSNSSMSECSSSSSAGSSGWVQAAVEALLSALASTATAAKELLGPQQSGGIPAWGQELRLAAAAVEAGLRTVAGAAAGGQSLQHMANYILRLLNALSTEAKRVDTKDNAVGSDIDDSTDSEDHSTAAGCIDSEANLQLFALLISSLKLAALEPSSALAAAVRVPAAAKFGVLVSKDVPPPSLQPAAGATLLPAMMPWLVVMARVCMALERLIAAQSSTQEQTLPAQAAGSGKGAAQARPSLLDWQLWMFSLSETWRDLCNILKQITMEQQLDAPACCASLPAPTATALSAAVVQPELAQLVQQWEQQLLPQVEQATLLVRYVWYLHIDPAGADKVLSELQAAAAAAKQLANEAAAVTGSGMDQINRVRLQLILNSPLMQQLLQQLEAAGNQLCALLPTPLCCNNPGCGNVNKQSELLLVGGKACVCAGCEVARYCGRECQAAHWQAHKRVCRMIKRSRTAAPVAAAATKCSPSPSSAEPEMHG